LWTSIKEIEVKLNTLKSKSVLQENILRKSEELASRIWATLSPEVTGVNPEKWKQDQPKLKEIIANLRSELKAMKEKFNSIK
jgi:hypothetical protein